MTFSGAFEIVLTLALTVVAAYPIGAYVADVLDNRRTFPHSNHRPARTVSLSARWRRVGRRARVARICDCDGPIRRDLHVRALRTPPVTRLAAPQSAGLSRRVARLGV
jgi:hypothetical protein